MQIINRGKIPESEWWINKVVECGNCLCAVQLEEDDVKNKLVQLHNKGQEIESVSLTCPHCKSQIIEHHF